MSKECKELLTHDNICVQMGETMSALMVSPLMFLHFFSCYLNFIFTEIIHPDSLKSQVILKPGKSPATAHPYSSLSPKEPLSRNNHFPFF